MTDTDSTPTSQERADLLESLRAHRDFLLTTVRGITDDQARERTTASEVTLGGLVKHVCATEKEWADFVVEGPSDGPDIDWANVDWSDPPPEARAYADGFTLLPEETLADVVAAYESVAARTDELVATVDLDHAHPLPAAPWFTPGATRSARRVFIHVVAETAQHSGHADIIREALDGQKTMG